MTSFSFFKHSFFIFHYFYNLRRLSYFKIECSLKGVFAKNERGYRLNAIKKTLLIAANPTSICCVYKEKILKTTQAEDCSVHTNLERCNIQLPMPIPICNWRICTWVLVDSDSIYESSSQISECMHPIIHIF